MRATAGEARRPADQPPSTPHKTQAPCPKPRQEKGRKGELFLVFKRNDSPFLPFSCWVLSKWLSLIEITIVARRQRPTIRGADRPVCRTARARGRRSRTARRR